MTERDASGELQVGDVVRLVSGGPKMTIENFAYNGRQAFCKWFVRSGGTYDLKTATFDAEALEPVEEEKDDERSRD